MLTAILYCAALLCFAFVIIYNLIIIGRKNKNQPDPNEKYEDLLTKYTLVSAAQETLKIENERLVDELGKATQTIEKITHQKKSSEVRTGQIAEQLAPFISGFPYDPKKSHFISQPIDYIVFDEAGIHFVEVKSGSAQLSSSQRKIREDIEQKRITFEVFRIDGG